MKKVYARTYFGQSDLFGPHIGIGPPSNVDTIGAAAAKIESQIKGTEIIHAETLENAIRLAADSAHAGDIVLLAPACASFDQFRSYEHRGKLFKEVVHSLAEAKAEAK